MMILSKKNCDDDKGRERGADKKKRDKMIGEVGEKKEK